MAQSGGVPETRPVPGKVLPIAALGFVFVATMAAGLRSMPGDEPSTTARARYLMGTRLLIECRGKVAPQVFEEAFGEVARLEGILSNWIESSEISRLNREGLTAPFPVSAELMRAVETSLTWAERTDGAFDPTVESLVRRYGIRDGLSVTGDRAPRDDDPNGVIQAKERESLRAVVGWRHVVVDGKAQTVHLTENGIGIDLGGIGKGIALDQAAKILAARGAGTSLLDFGGQLLVTGAPPEDGWLIGVADPGDRRQTVATVILRAGSLATSGNSERAVIGEQGTVGHILDPRVGAPAPFRGSVSVLAADGATADALSTALFVMGPATGLEWAEERGIAALFIRQEAGRGLEFLTTSTMRSNLAREPKARSVAGGN